MTVVREDGPGERWGSVKILGLGAGVSADLGLLLKYWKVHGE